MVDRNAIKVLKNNEIVGDISRYIFTILLQCFEYWRNNEIDRITVSREKKCRQVYMLKKQNVSLKIDLVGNKCVHICCVLQNEKCARL